jgi:putative hydrolase of the HAD superfamily
LDALGTLVELEPPARRLRDELVRRLGLSVSEADAQQAIAAEMVYYRAHLNEGRDPASLAELRGRCAEVLWRELAGEECAGAPEPDVIVDVLMASLSFRAFADVPGALTALRELGLVLIVVSNWDASLPGVLDRVGLAGHVDGVVTSAQVGVRKPDRAIFDQALALAGARPEEAVHVGDSVAEDVDGARAAGIEAVLLARREVGSNAAPRIRSLSELPALLRR